MKKEIINGVPTHFCETAEEATEGMWPKKEQEKFRIEESLDEIEYALEIAESARGEFIGQNPRMLEKVETDIAELKREHKELKRRLRELAEKQ